MGNPSGQIFVSDQYGPYNVVVAYGNNDDPVDARPDSYPYPVSRVPAQRAFLQDSRTNTLIGSER